VSRVESEWPTLFILVGVGAVKVSVSDSESFLDNLARHSWFGAPFYFKCQLWKYLSMKVIEISHVPRPKAGMDWPLERVKLLSAVSAESIAIKQFRQLQICSDKNYNWGNFLICSSPK
jgi:hypothetical protein